MHAQQFHKTSTDASYISIAAGSYRLLIFVKNIKSLAGEVALATDLLEKVISHAFIIREDIDCYQ